ncbi:MAG: immunoglobulin domain-containing protein [Holophagaceae bacterium]|nr:immunoglobulin domain-containing protein [Holophagaceae bacterium]
MQRSIPYSRNKVTVVLCTSAFLLTLGCSGGDDNAANGSTPQNVAPVFTVNPQPQFITLGQTATFTVAASGTPTPLYQWMKNGNQISGAVAATYTTTGTTKQDNDSSFSVIASNVAGSTTSASAALHVQWVPTITFNPVSLSVPEGQQAKFSVTAEGSPSPKFQWQREGQDIQGATTGTYTIPAAGSGDNQASFTVVVSNSLGHLTSNPAVLTVVPLATPPTITSQPTDRLVTEGQSASFNVAASGSTPMSYQWQRDQSDILGAVADTWILPSASISDSGAQFRCHVSNSAGSVYSSPAKLTVNQADNQAPSTPLITTGPTSAVTKHQYTYNLSSVDPEGDPITYSLAVANADASITGNVLTYRPSTPSFGGAPINTTLSVVAKDSHNNTSPTGTITVNVIANRAPVFTSGNTLQVTGDVATAPSTFRYTATATDPDTDTVTFAVRAGSVSIKDNVGSYVATPSTWTDGLPPISGGVVSFPNLSIPSGKTAVRVTFAVIARDVVAFGDSDPSERAVTATYSTGNLAPIITSTSIPGVPQNHGIPVNSGVQPYQFSASDSVGDTLTWSLVTAPVGFALSSAGMLTWASNFAAGADFAARSITVKVTDQGGLSDTKTFQINIVPDSKPIFSAQTYTETVTNVQLHEPSNLRQKITGHSYFNFLDTNAADREYYADLNNSIKGWRAGVTATDAENDVMVYSVKPNSVFRFGVPFGPYGTPNDSNSAPAGGRYPYIVPGPGTDTSSTGVVRKPGEIAWRPGYGLALPGSDGLVLNTGINVDAVTGVIDGIPVHDPVNWSITLSAQELVGTSAIPGQYSEMSLSIKVQPNHQPAIGALTTINLPAITAGVNLGAGTAVTPNIGRPSIQEPVASDTSTPGTPSKWIWAIGTPGTAGTDANIADPNTIPFHGHQDAIQVFFGNAPYNAANGIGVLLALAGNFPVSDATGNYPSVLTSGSIPNGFYNPWLSAVTPMTYTVSWAPIRIQYQLGRYLAYAYSVANGYSFPAMVEDQYTLSNSTAVNIFPIFGTVKFFNSRFRFRADQTTDYADANRGSFTTTGNTETAYAASTTNFNYVLSYLPCGVSVTSSEWIDAATTETYGANLFGSSTGVGAPASGTANTNGTVFSAGNWHTLDGRNAGHNPGYPPNPVNVLMDPATRAAAVPGTLAGGTHTYTQFKGGAVDATGGNPSAVSVTVSGAYSNNEVLARMVPSNSPYLFMLGNATSPTAIADGYNAPRYKDFWLEGSPLDDSYVPRWFYGRAQSEVDYSRVIPGRPIFYSSSAANPMSENVDNLSTSATPTTGGRLRISFTWPTQVTNTAAGYPAAGTPDTFNEPDVIQVATPNLSGNARFFFSGNYPAADLVSGVPNPLATREATPGANNYFGKFGLTTVPSYTAAGVSTSTPPHQPIAAVTNSLWVPNNSDKAFNFPNAYTMPAGGSGYTDIPFTGIRGWVDRFAVTHLIGGGIVGTDENISNYPGWWSILNVAQVPGLNHSLTGNLLDNNANPALISTGTGADRTFFVWMKAGNNQTGTNGVLYNNAYGAWAGSMLAAGSPSVKGGVTLAPGFSMTNNGLTDPFTQISFASNNGSLPYPNQSLTSNTGITQGWKRGDFELLRSLVAAPAQFGLGARARLVDPSVGVTVAATMRRGQFETPGSAIFDSIPQNSFVVYAVKDRGTKTTHNGSSYSNLLGEAGLEPGSPVLAQWWNTGNGDITLGNFPLVVQAYANEFIPADFTEVVHINHNFAAEVIYPSSATPILTDNVYRLYPQIGLIAPKGHTLLSKAQGVTPVVTPVRQLAINDLKINTATGTTVAGTMLDLFNGQAQDPATGAPASGSPSYKLADGNATGVGDFRLNGYSNVQITFKPAVSDLRHPSGYVVTLYRVDNSVIVVQGEWRMGHLGGVGMLQTLNLPAFVNLDHFNHTPGNTAAYAIKVRNVWYEGTEGASGHSRDLGKEPWAIRFPMAYADVVSGAFLVAF